MAFLLQISLLPSSFPTSSCSVSSSSSSSSSSSPLPLFRSSSPPSPLSFSTASTLFPPPPSSSSSSSSSSTLLCSFPVVRAQPPPMSEFASEAFESERLRLDAQARLEMKEVADAAADLLDASSSSDSAAASNDGAWKWSIRKRVWDMMERENLAVHPRPVHHRIPNFVGAPTAAAKLASLPVFQAANCVKVNPDTPQKQVRYLTLEAKKKLLTPQPRLRTGFFSELEVSTLPEGVLAEACTALGVAKYGKPLGLDAELKVDLIVIGSVAVDPKTGARLGKGEGFAELEYGMLRHMGAIDDSTIVVTSIHDKQLVDDIPVEKLKIHDVPVDIICTPTRIIYTNTAIPKPKGIYWELLSPEKLGQIRVLRELKKKIEKETGTKLPVGPSEKLPPTAERRGTKPPVKKQDTAGKSSNVDSVFVWNLDVSTSWRELKDHASKAGADVLKVNVIRKQGSPRPMAQIFLNEGVTDVDAIVKALDRSRLGRATIRAKINVLELQTLP